MSLRFSEGAECMLRRAGWYPGPTVGIESWRVPLQEFGFVRGSGVTGDTDDARVYSGALAEQDVRDLYLATSHFG